MFIRIPDEYKAICTFLDRQGIPYEIIEPLQVEVVEDDDNE